MFDHSKAAKEILSKRTESPKTAAKPTRKESLKAAFKAMQDDDFDNAENALRAAGLTFAEDDED